jgi:predicted nucleotidyltransferase
VSPAPGRGVFQALAALDAALRDLGVPAMIIGGIAVIARGVPRATADVDATVWGAAVSLDDLFATLAHHEIVPRTSGAEEFARRRQVLLLHHEPSGTPLEVSLGWLPFELEAMERATRIDLGDLSIPVPQVQDLIVYKAVAWRERDKEDIERLLVLHRDEVDLDAVRELVRQFAEALEDSKRVGELEALVKKAFGN